MDKLNALERSAKWNADNFEPVTVAGTKEILAIAEAFRELEQRVEAAEAEAEDTDKTMRAYSDQLVKVTAELVAAQAQIAEMANREPAAFRLDPKEGPSYLSFRCGEDLKESGFDFADCVPLFTRPAPAAVPVDLVPDEGELERLYSVYCTPTVGSKNAIRHIRKEMLRRIEGMK